ncbi:glycine betaine/proline transport system ATP-binding protein [Alkalibaculum bacchi]|uniref:Quaternary amine transport ATP-binding protein n=1 Tax=Alkalibaculum bacchi TaxID=645887 RepID=A0A366I2G7_9FIRM|nr:glycine betaine/L-proline ABC transporter ATP-binding protein [Alkalibaculum bacchi]RBP61386.1 glycine betaine/proline transport system ATP-binding protein [Alkalibaculum bacchi]
MTGNENILSVKNLYKLYGSEKSKTLKLKQSGADKNEIYKKTGVNIALWDVSLDIKRGEIFVIIGLSGSGKSTLVRCFNMLNKPTKGNIYIEGKNINEFSKKELIDYRRNKISMVFQNFGLMSHRNVIENVAYGLEIKGVSREERYKKALEMIEMVGLEGYEKEPITSLSGGMKQRVGIARALASDAEILLMDEPFSALDPLVRKDMQFELLSIQKKLDKTIIFITHDINEAFKLGDKVAIMKDGEVIQVDTPEEMSANPKDDYVTQFIDSADKTQVISAKNVMSTPDSIVRLKDTPAYAMKVMRSNKVSTAYVVKDKMLLQGVITIDDAMRANKEGLTISDVLIKDIETTTPNVLLTDIIPMAAETKYPIGVIEEDGSLKGIVTKADVLSYI